MKPERHMSLVGDVLAGVLDKLNLGRALTGWRAIEAWNDAAGAETAAHSRGVRHERGRLIVEVESSAWMTRLSMEKPVLLERIGAMVGPSIVRDIVFVLAGRPVKEEKT